MKRLNSAFIMAILCLFAFSIGAPQIPKANATTPIIHLATSGFSPPEKNCVSVSTCTSASFTVFSPADQLVVNVQIQNDSLTCPFIRTPSDSSSDVFTRVGSQINASLTFSGFPFCSSVSIFTTQLASGSSRTVTTTFSTNTTNIYFQANDWSGLDLAAKAIRNFTCSGSCGFTLATPSASYLSGDVAIGAGFSGGSLSIFGTSGLNCQTGLSSGADPALCLYKIPTGSGSTTFGMSSSTSNFPQVLLGIIFGSLPITVDSNPTNLPDAITVDGTMYLTNPQTFGWAVGSSHNLTAKNLITVGGVDYGFGCWEVNGTYPSVSQGCRFFAPSGNSSSIITTPAFPTTYTALYYSVVISSNMSATLPGHVINVTATETCGTTPNCNLSRFVYNLEIVNMTGTPAFIGVSGGYNFLQCVSPHNSPCSVLVKPDITHVGTQTFMAQVSFQPYYPNVGGSIVNSSSITLTWGVGGPLCVAYTVIGGGIYNAPILTYQNGTTLHYTLTHTLTCVTRDPSTLWTVSPNPLAGDSSSTVERAYSNNVTSGFVGGNYTFVY